MVSDINERAVENLIVGNEWDILLEETERKVLSGRGAYHGESSQQNENYQGGSE